MPAGDLVTLNHQFEIRATLFGRGTSVHIDAQMIGGLGIPETKTQQVQVDGEDGEYAGPDYLGARILSIPYRIVATSEANAMLAVKALNVAWAPSQVDIPLHLRLPGFDHFSVNGRPRGGSPDLSQAKVGIPRGLLRFDCLDPTITYH